MQKTCSIIGESTPNPNAQKFYQTCISESGTVEFLKESDQLDQSPIAKKLFDIEGIDIVMIDLISFL